MKRKQAIVIGGSIAGLTAARVLADHYERVLIIERDDLPDGATVRKSAPQGAHTHALLARGLRTLERLMPGLTRDLVEQGAVECDTTADFAWYQHGVFKGRWPSGQPALSMTRPLLEWRMRIHVLATPNITLMAGHRVVSLITTADRTRITGVRAGAVDGPEGAVRELEADLVVDATGRGSRVPGWLEELGCGAVPVTEIKSDVRYVSRIFRNKGPAPDFKLGLFQDDFPSTHLGAAFRVESDACSVTLQTMLGEEVPNTEAGFLAYARSIAVPHLAQLLEQSEPLSPLLFYRIPSNLRRHYERMARFPDGLAIIGDAATAFNPRYGQGMAAAVLGAEVLEQSLKEPAFGGPGSGQRFQKALAKAMDLPWEMSAGEDLPFLEKSLPLSARFAGWYVRRLLRLCSVDREAVVAFAGVMHLLRPMSDLFRPRLLWKVLTLNERRLLAN
ncbi:MAG TPA: FAD-dependent oxidoreductase [Symbiobacteriaceae bacterium]|nr:FAD-dependent oxidoreductase [Symbiobacteriaceae bacterium]